MYVSRETHVDALSPQLTKHINHPTAQPSPNHKHGQAAVGRVDCQRGLSLRFPRFLRVRDDKGVEDATPADTIADLFRMQARGGVVFLINMCIWGRPLLVVVLVDSYCRHLHICVH